MMILLLQLFLLQTITGTTSIADAEGDEIDNHDNKITMTTTTLFQNNNTNNNNKIL